MNNTKVPDRISWLANHSDIGCLSFTATCCCQQQPDIH